MVGHRGSVLMDNRHGLKRTEKGYDTPEFVAGVRECRVTPILPRNVHAHKPRNAIEERTTRHAGYAISQRKLREVEESLG